MSTPQVLKRAREEAAFGPFLPLPPKRARIEAPRGTKRKRDPMEEDANADRTKRICLERPAPTAGEPDFSQPHWWAPFFTEGRVNTIFRRGSFSPEEVAYLCQEALRQQRTCLERQFQRALAERPPATPSAPSPPTVDYMSIYG